MGNRSLRVNELVRQEISDILHKRYQKESVLLTITSVDVAPDLRTGKVYFSVVASEAQPEEYERWLRTRAGEIQHELGRRIVLKFTPQLQFLFDPSMERGAHLLKLLDELDHKSEKDA